MSKALAPGGVVTATRIDRSAVDLFATAKQIVDAAAQFRSLAVPRADTATSTGRLVIAVPGGLADLERDLIRTRNAEGATLKELAETYNVGGATISRLGG